MSQSYRTVHLPSLSEMFRVRDWLVEQWMSGAMSADEAESKLRAIAVVDGLGNTWMLRPTPTGSVLVRMSPTGDVSMPLPDDFVSPQRKSRIGTAAMLFGGMLWLIVAFTWIRGG